MLRDKENILCKIYLAMFYVSHGILLTFIQYPIISVAIL